MKTILLLSICALVSASVLAGPTLTTGSNFGPWQYGNGGEFTVKPTGTWPYNPLPLYAEVAKNEGSTQGTFQTFCVENTPSAPEYIYLNTTYDVVLNDGAVLGGVGGEDPLSQGAAFLYHQFQTGSLTIYDYANTGVGRKVSANELQNAIWALEGEATTGISDAYKTLLTQEFSSDSMTVWQYDNNGKYGVKVLNLYVQGYAGDLAYLRQDVLVCVPAPGAMLLGSIGVCFVGWLRRKRTI